MDKYKILFVCLGNICRSPAAEGVMKAIVKAEGQEHAFYIDSAGTGRYHIGQQPDSRMLRHARKRGIALNHRCRQVTEQDFYDFDIIIGMDDANVEYLNRLAPSVEAQKKVRRMADFLDRDTSGFDHVPDPYYEGAEGFELVLDLLEDGCRRLYDTVTA